MTTRSQIIDNIIQAIIAATSFSASCIYVSAVPHFLYNAPASTSYIEIIPGAQSNEQGNVGLGVAEFSFSICVFTMLFDDRLNDSTDRIALNTRSLINLIQTIDGVLLNNSLGGTLASTIYPAGIDAPEQSPVENDGWVMERRSYGCTFEFSYPGVT